MVQCSDQEVLSGHTVTRPVLDSVDLREAADPGSYLKGRTKSPVVKGEVAARHGQESSGFPA